MKSPAHRRAIGITFCQVIAWPLLVLPLRLGAMVLGTTMVATVFLCTPTPDSTFVGPQPAPEESLDWLDEVDEVDDETDEADDTSCTQEPVELTAFAESAPYDYGAPEEDDDEPWDGGMYFSAGLAPMSTLHAEGFHPGLRFDVETGMAWQRGRAKIHVGPDFHIMQYYGRKKPGFGVDAMMTLSLKHVYGRVGAGTATRIPAYRDLEDTRPMMGALVGGGLVGRIDDVEGRIGIDYDVRIDTTGRVAQTVLVAMRISFGP